MIKSIDKFMSTLVSNARCILEGTSVSGRSFDVILWHVFLKRTHSSVLRTRESCNKVTTDRCRLSLVQLGSNLSPSYLQRSIFHTPLEWPETLDTYDQKYATSITCMLWYGQKRNGQILTNCLLFFPSLFPEMSCLLEALDDRSIQLRSDCLNMLKARKEMWEYAAKVSICISHLTFDPVWFDLFWPVQWVWTNKKHTLQGVQSCIGNQ